MNVCPSKSDLCAANPRAGHTFVWFWVRGNGQCGLTHFVLHVHRLVQEEKKKKTEDGYIYTNIYIYTYIEIRCIFFVCDK